MSDINAKNEPIEVEPAPEPTQEPAPEPTQTIEYDESFINDIVDKATARLEKKGRAGRKEAKASEKNAKKMEISDDSTQSNIRIYIGLILALICGFAFYKYSKLKSNESDKNETKA